MKSPFMTWKQRRMTVLILCCFLQYRGPVGRFCVRSRLGTMFPLLDGGRAANLKFEQTGVKFATPTVNKLMLW